MKSEEKKTNDDQVKKRKQSRPAPSSTKLSGMLRSTNQNKGLVKSSTLNQSNIDESALDLSSEGLDVKTQPMNLQNSKLSQDQASE